MLIILNYSRVTSIFVNKNKMIFRFGSLKLREAPCACFSFCSMFIEETIQWFLLCQLTISIKRFSLRKVINQALYFLKT
jgi:hypothetical protein